MSDAGYSMLGAGARGWPREMLWGGRWEGVSCLGTHVHPWWSHVNVWQNQYSIVKENKVKIKIKKKKAVFFCSYVWVWKLEYIESWAPKNLCLWTVVLEKTLESPLACKAIQPVHPKGNQSWIFIVRTDAEAETPILQPPYSKNCLIGNNPDTGKDWRLEEKGTTEDEMVRWHHRFNGHECEQAPGIGDGKGSLVCCSPWGQKSQTRLSDWKTMI